MKLNMINETKNEEKKTLKLTTKWQIYLITWRSKASFYCKLNN